MGQPIATDRHWKERSASRPEEIRLFVPSQKFPITLKRSFWSGANALRVSPLTIHFRSPLISPRFRISGIVSIQGVSLLFSSQLCQRIYLEANHGISFLSGYRWSIIYLEGDYDFSGRDSRLVWTWSDRISRWDVEPTPKSGNVEGKSSNHSGRAFSEWGNVPSSTVPHAYLTREAAAEYLRLSPGMLRDNHKHIPFLKLGGKVLHTKKDLDGLVHPHPKKWKCWRETLSAEIWMETERSSHLSQSQWSGRVPTSIAKVVGKSPTKYSLL
jgi:hypothetical protein